MAEGLQLAWDLGIKKVILESDSDEIIHLILDDFCDTGSNLVVKVKDMLSWDWRVDVRVISREVNRIVDALAKSGISYSGIVDGCPGYLRNWVEQESLGLNSSFL